MSDSPPSSTRPFVLAVNYWPRRKAMYWWKDFDRAEIENEFAEIGGLGIHVVRIFLFWEDFQPAPQRINDRALADLGAVLDIAHTLGLQVMPTFFTGHMSGANWWPVWALSDEEQPGGTQRIVGGRHTNRIGRDPYADPVMLDAEIQLIDAVCGRYGAHPAVYSWNLGNESDIFAVPRTYEEGATWTATMADRIRRHSKRPVSFGAHLPDILAYRGFRPDLLSHSCDYLSMHGYSIYYGPTARDDPLNSDVVPLACLVTEALAGGTPVLFEEFGYASSEHGNVSEYRMVNHGTQRQYFADDVAGGRYYREVLEKLGRCGAMGAGAWMFSDYARSLWNRPPFDTHEHERFFGLTRSDGSVKPSGEAIREFSRRCAHGDLPDRSIGPLILDPTEYYLDPGGAFDRLFREWSGRISGE